MPAADLIQFAKNGNFDDFEAFCLSAMESGELALGEVSAPFLSFERHTEPARVASLAQMILDSAGVDSDPAAALEIARVAVVSDPESAAARERLAGLYRAVHGDRADLDALLEAANLIGSRYPRNSIRLLELCLNLKKGDVLAARAEETVVEVIDVDFGHGLCTVRRDGRPRSLTPSELVREYERVDPEDLRVLRQLRPERLAAMLEKDPVKIVVNILRTHHEPMTQDALKHELVPRYLTERDWSKWWTKARGELRRAPNVVLEGRNPVVLTYSDEARTAEDDAWDQFVAQSEPDKWLAAVEGYIRDRKKDRAEPDPELLQRFHKHLVDYLRAIQSKRPEEAFACALVTEKIDAEAGVSTQEAEALAVEMLRGSDAPAAWIGSLTNAALWDLALGALVATGREDLGLHVAALLRSAPATVIDKLVALARQFDRLQDVQVLLDEALAEPLDHPETLYWLWKGPDNLEGLNPPPLRDLFEAILGTLHALGRSLNPSDAVMKNFRARMKSALSLRDGAQVRACIEKIEPDRGITLKTQFQQLSGLGNNLPGKLLDILRDVHPRLWQVTRRRIEAWEDLSVLWNTRAGIQRKTEERDFLVNVTMRENAKRIGEAASLGDLSENAEYKFALEERDLLRARLAQMNNEISIADVIDPAGVPTERIGVGSRVELRDLASGEIRVLCFFGPFDTDVDQNIYNYRAPIAQKMMGLQVGEHVGANLQGVDGEFEIMAISNGLVHSPAS